MNILFVGDVVGEPGREALMRFLAGLKKEYALHMVVVNGENAAAGRGITPGIAQAMFRAGVDVITMGDHVWDQKELVSWMDSEPRLLRPLNYPQGTPGWGSVVVDTPAGKVAVMQLQGRSFIQPPLENPFLSGMGEAERLRNECGVNVILVDIHAETTSEKISMGYHLDGHVSAVMGTHTHVQTADEKVLEGGTAYITDVGMCGPDDGVLGREKTAVIRRFCTSMPAKFPVADWPVRMCGVIVQVNEATGKAVSIQRLNRLIAKHSS